MPIAVSVDVKIQPGVYASIMLTEKDLMHLAERKAEEENVCWPKAQAYSLRLIAGRARTPTKGMTVARLHKLLGDQLAAGHARKPVCVAKDTFVHNCESDGVTILDVRGTKMQWVLRCDDDGGVDYCKDGTEKGFTALVLEGGAS